jgi:hypothetical protein
MNPSFTQPGEREREREGFGREEKSEVSPALFNLLYSEIEILFPTYNFSVIVFFT